MLILNADGGCWPNPGIGRFGVVVSTDGRVVCRLAKRIGQATSNVAEWRGALAALDYALVHLRQHRAVELRMDSQLVVHQLNGRWKVHHDGLKPLAREGHRMLDKLRSAGVVVKVRWIPREQNADADELAARA